MAVQPNSLLLGEMFEDPNPLGVCINNGAIKFRFLGDSLADQMYYAQELAYMMKRGSGILYQVIDRALVLGDVSLEDAVNMLFRSGNSFYYPAGDRLIYKCTNEADVLLNEIVQAGEDFMEFLSLL